MLVVGRDENDVRRRVRFDHPAGDLEAGEPGHLDIKKDDVGLQPIDRREGLDAVARLADDGHAADLPQQEPQLVARQLLVVDQNRSQVHDVTPSRVRESTARESPD